MNKHGHYYKTIPAGVTEVDVYSILILWGVTCPARQHAIKKLLCAGSRGSKSAATDLQEAIDAIERAKGLLGEYWVES